LKRIVWTVLALLFLGVSWLWDTLHPLIRRFIDILPLDGMKRAVVRFMDRLPPYVTLAVFLIPLLASEPVKIVAFWLFTRKQWLPGVLVYAGAELLRFGLVAFLFNACRDKLLSISWFARMYVWFVRVHEWAHEQVEPLRASLRAYAHRAFVEAGLSGGRGSFWRRLMALWRYTRRTRAV
jgi:hypothetical protein